MTAETDAGKPVGLRRARQVARPVRHWWRMRPRLGLALRTSIAGGLAWLAAHLLPGQEPQQYAYFAPMGAVVVTSMTVVATAKGLLRSVAALSLGSAIGLLALTIVEPNAITVAVVIAVSVLAAGWRPLGSMRAWVPTVAIFTMVLGRGQPWTYVTAYTGLSALGAAIGVIVVTLMPQLMVAPLEEAGNRLWLSITERLRRLRDDLRNDDHAASFGTGMTDSIDLDSARRRLEDRLSEADDARQINRRSRRHDVGRRIARARAIDKVATQLQEVERRLEDLATPDKPGTPDDPTELECRLADVIDLVHDALRKASTDDLDQSLEPALTALDDIVVHHPADGPGLHKISALVNELRNLGLAARHAVEANAAAT